MYTVHVNHAVLLDFHRLFVCFLVLIAPISPNCHSLSFSLSLLLIHVITPPPSLFLLLIHLLPLSLFLLLMYLLSRSLASFYSCTYSLFLSRSLSLLLMHLIPLSFYIPLSVSLLCPLFLPLSLSIPFPHSLTLLLSLFLSLSLSPSLAQYEWSDGIKPSFKLSYSLFWVHPFK